MSWVTKKKDPELRSRKLCVCGGHSANDRKKCLHHHSTARKRTFQLNREFKRQMRAGEDYAHS